MRVLTAIVNAVRYPWPIAAWILAVWPAISLSHLPPGGNTELRLAPVAAPSLSTHAPPRSLLAETGAPLFTSIPSRGQRSDIVVHGVVVLGNRGMAVISASGKPQDNFVAGMELQPGLRLEGVAPDGIVVSHGGAREFYPLQGGGHFRPAAPAMDTGLTSVPAVVPTVSGSHTESKFTISRQAIGQRLNSPQELLSQAVMLPTPQGMLLSEIDSGSIINEWGLQTGDVLTRLNGQTLRDPDDLRRSVELVKQASQVHLEIEREGKPLMLVYRLY